MTAERVLRHAASIGPRPPAGSQETRPQAGPDIDVPFFRTTAGRDGSPRRMPDRHDPLAICHRFGAAARIKFKRPAIRAFVIFGSASSSASGRDSGKSG
jgi:hypothetical protein